MVGVLVGIVIAVMITNFFINLYVRRSLRKADMSDFEGHERRFRILGYTTTLGIISVAAVISIFGITM